PLSKPGFLINCAAVQPPTEVTVNEYDVVCVAEAAVPVIVIGYVPAGVEALVVIVRVLLPPAVTEAGLNEAVAPLGRPDAVSATDSAVPETSAVETVEVADAPETTEPEAGAAAIEKSFVTVPVPATTSIFAAFQPDT